MIQTLIDKFDNSELIRDKIADILVTEAASQVALATTAGKPDPSLWDLRVFTERSNPFEEFLGESRSHVPIINVWFDSGSFDLKLGNVVERQTVEGTFNIDCYGQAESFETMTGHSPGDRDAALEAMRAVRLVRNILMSAEYTYLKMRGTVGRRWIQSIRAFQPTFDGANVVNIVGIRVSFSVVYNETSPQIQGEPIELVQVTTKRQSDGQVILVTEYAAP